MIEPRSSLPAQTQLCRCGHDYKAHLPEVTVTIGGTPETGDNTSVTINGVVVTVAETTGETDEQLAQALVNAINATPALVGGITPSIFQVGTPVAGVFKIISTGAMFTYSGSATGGGATILPSGASTPVLTCQVCIGVCLFMSDLQFIANSGIGEGPTGGAGDLAGFFLRTETLGPEGHFTGSNGSEAHRPPIAYHS